MPQRPIKINLSQPIVNIDSTMAAPFMVSMLKLAETIPIVGSGNPESVVEAPQYTLYIDETTPTTPVQYRKMITQIGGDVKKGWIVV